MSFRTRLTLAAAAAVAVAVVGASAITYAIVRNELRDDVDATLQSRARELPPHLQVVGGPGGEQFLGLRARAVRRRRRLHPARARATAV